MYLPASLMLFGLSFNATINAGIWPDTLVKTTTGYGAIQSLKNNDPIISFDGVKAVPDQVRHVWSVIHASGIKISFKDDAILVSPQQRFYLPVGNKWVAAVNLRRGDYLLNAAGYKVEIMATEFSEGPVRLYDISVLHNHNFFISQHELLVHNAIPIMFSLAWAFGGGAIEYIGGGLALGWLGFAVCKDQYNARKSSMHIGNFGISIGGFPDPEDPRNKNRKDLNKLIEKTAEQLGYKRVKEYPFDSHGEKVFKKGSEYISFDRDCHRGGFWKLFDLNGKRVATLCINLINVIGK